MPRHTEAVAAALLERHGRRVATGAQAVERRKLEAHALAREDLDGADAGAGGAMLVSDIVNSLPV